MPDVARWSVAAAHVSRRHVDNGISPPKRGPNKGERAFQAHGDTGEGIFTTAKPANRQKDGAVLYTNTTKAARPTRNGDAPGQNGVSSGESSVHLATAVDEMCKPGGHSCAHPFPSDHPSSHHHDEMYSTNGACSPSAQSHYRGSHMERTGTRRKTRFDQSHVARTIVEDDTLALGRMTGSDCDEDEA
ncbi:hypothetical protein LSH36_409g02004 [Paralvinella palmiformis]|uniref:Uncharacterized protein n=1 Tax=Paralvinella palmiformis TaxID=53620 RepID=A0AAD9JCJ8_9ANNE|nr:hypothetical protein LSH36_409g02004 [Paralvinella palmiformis]